MNTALKLAKTKGHSLIAIAIENQMFKKLLKIVKQSAITTADMDIALSFIKDLGIAKLNQVDNSQ